MSSAAQDQPLVGATAGAGGSSSAGFAHTENGNEDFIIQAQGQGDSDTSSDEGYYRYVGSTVVHDPAL